MSLADRLALECFNRRERFGYDYRRGDYNPAFKMIAPWSTGSLVQSAPNLRLALLREVAPSLPVHDQPRIPPQFGTITSEQPCAATQPLPTPPQRNQD